MSHPKDLYWPGRWRSPLPEKAPIAHKTCTLRTLSRFDAVSLGRDRVAVGVSGGALAALDLDLDLTEGCSHLEASR